MSRNPFRKTVGFYEVMATSYTDGGGTTGTGTGSFNNSGNQMETYKNPYKEPTNGSPRNVGFTLKDKHSEKKTKYLTAKYGSHQMSLIKKRLKVEMWVFEELRKLYDSEDDDYDCILDLEEVLNLETDNERRQYALDQLKGVRQSQENVNRFIDELLRQVKTL